MLLQIELQVLLIEQLRLATLGEIAALRIPIVTELAAVIAELPPPLGLVLTALTAIAALIIRVTTVAILTALTVTALLKKDRTFISVIEVSNKIAVLIEVQGLLTATALIHPREPLRQVELEVLLLAEAELPRLVEALRLVEVPAQAEAQDLQREELVAEAVAQEAHLEAQEAVVQEVAEDNRVI